MKQKFYKDKEKNGGGEYLGRCPMWSGKENTWKNAIK